LLRTLGGAVSGFAVAQFREPCKLIDIVRRAPGNERVMKLRLQDLQRPLGNGRYTPLSQVATVHELMKEPIIRRPSRVPTLQVRADLVATVLALLGVPAMYAAWYRLKRSPAG
jgi:multidrug efflux pump